MKQTIPLLITFFLSLFFAVQFFIPHQYLKDTYEYLLSCVMIIGCFAMILGIYSLTRVHFVRIKRKGTNWQYSYLTFFGLALTIIVGWFGSIESGSIAEGCTFDFIYNSVLNPIQATMFSLLAFFIASAAYRAFRARSLAATILLLTAVVVMLGRVPVGEWIHPKLPDFASWLLNVPNLAAKRAIMIGIGLGASATSLKVALGIERSHFGG
ncbi:hypothetical protein KKB18_11535 [bacterium]|nr:hypothetical protein [bacterium]